MPQRTKLQNLSTIVLRIICYGMLIIFGLSFVTRDILVWFGACPSVEQVAITCTSEAASWIASTSTAILVTGIFLGIPFLLGALIFVMVDISRLLTRKR